MQLMHMLRKGTTAGDSMRMCGRNYLGTIAVGRVQRGSRWSCCYRPSPPQYPGLLVKDRGIIVAVTGGPSVRSSYFLCTHHGVNAGR